MPSAAAEEILQAILEQRAAERRGALEPAAAPVVLPFAQRAPLKVYLNAGERDRVMGDQAPLPFSNRIAQAFEASQGMPEPSRALYAAKHQRAMDVLGNRPPVEPSFLENIASLGPRALGGAEKMWRMTGAAPRALWNDPLGTVNRVGLAGQAATDAIVQGAVKPFTQFNDPNVDPVKQAADLALTVGAGGLATAAEREGLGVFGGRNAKTADIGKLTRATDMANGGFTPKEIWQETGWFKGKDDKWRFEIPDETSRVPDKTIDALAGTGSSGSAMGSAEKILQHPELYAAYPKLSNLDVYADYAARYPNSSGLYDSGVPQSATHHFGRDPQITMQLSALAGPEGPRSLMLHELQHPVQEIEGFARGANVNEYAHGPMFDEKARNLQDDLSQALTGGLGHKPSEIIRDMKYGDLNRIEAIVRKHGFNTIGEAADFLKKQDEMRTPFGQYRRTAGEVEARNVQTRRNMTPEERRATPPWATQDVPDEQQIVRFREGG